MPVEIVLTKAVSQLPTLTYPGWDDFGQISATLNQLEHGMFRHAAVMADQMWRDDRFYGVMRKRLDALESVPLIVNPADGRAKAKQIAQNLGGIDDMPGRWDTQFPAPQLEALNMWAILMGIGIGELIWRTDDDEDWIDVAPGTQYRNGKRLRWTSRLKVWNPQWLRWDWSLFRYRLMTAEGEITLPDVSADPRSDGKWLLWCPYGYHEAWKTGAVRAIARSITRRQWIDRDWSRENEKNAIALEKAIVPAEAPADAKQTFFDNVANRNGETAIMCEQSADPQKGKFDVELVEASTRSATTFEPSKQDVNSDIAIVLLGHNLTTEVKEGKGSLGMDGASAVSRNYLRKDAGIAMCLYQQNLSWDAEYNYGDATLAPRPAWQVDPPEDENAKADTLNKLGAGLAQMKTAGAPIDPRGVLEAAGLPTISVEEEAAQKAIQAEEDAARAQAAMAGPGGAGGGGGADGANDKNDSATKKLSAAATADAIRALGKLTERAIAARAAAKKSSSAATLKWARGLERAALQLGARSMSVDLAHVKHELEHAQNYQDLEQRLLRAYKGMDPKRLADVVAKSRIMGRLGGQLSAVKQT